MFFIPDIFDDIRYLFCSTGFFHNFLLYHWLNSPKKVDDLHRCINIFCLILIGKVKAAVRLIVRYQFVFQYINWIIPMWLTWRKYILNQYKIPAWLRSIWLSYCFYMVHSFKTKSNFCYEIISRCTGCWLVSEYRIPKNISQFCCF